METSFGKTLREREMYIHWECSISITRVQIPERMTTLSLSQLTQECREDMNINDVGTLLITKHHENEGVVSSIEWARDNNENGDRPSEHGEIGNPRFRSIQWSYWHDSCRYVDVYSMRRLNYLCDWSWHERRKVEEVCCCFQLECFYKQSAEI